MAFGNYLLKKTYMLVKLTSSKAMYGRTKTTRDNSWTAQIALVWRLIFDHMLDEDAWRSDWNMLEIYITIVPPQQNSLLLLPYPRLLASKNYCLRLREEEKKKFCRDGKTDKHSGIFICSGDEIMGRIERDNVVLIPTAATLHGHNSPLFNRLLYRHDTETHRVFKDRPNANICEDLERSTRTPHAILEWVNSIWRALHPREFYGESYKTMDPHT